MTAYRFITESYRDAYCRCGHHAEDHEEHSRRSETGGSVTWRTSYGQCLNDCGCGTYRRQR